LLSIAVFFEFSHVISVIFVPHRNIRIFALVVERLLATDVQIFLIVVVLYLTCFWTTMYINYPRAGTGKLAVIPPFNSMRDSFEAMLSLGIAGIHFDIDFSSDAVLALEDDDILNQHKLVDLVLFSFFYYYCMLLLVILLLRMLMAMLTATFAAVRALATLQFRLQFARHVLELELVAELIGVPTHSGERFGSEWFHVFKAYTDADEEELDAMEEDDKAAWKELTGTRSSNSFTRHSHEDDGDEPGANQKSLRASMRHRRPSNEVRPSIRPSLQPRLAHMAAKEKGDTNHGRTRRAGSTQFVQVKD